MDLISSKTEKSRAISINRVSGETSNIINKLRDKLVHMISNIEVNIDYPEYDDIEVVTNEKIMPDLTNIKEEITRLISKANDGKLIEEGIKVVIVGKPNVGKSSLLNQLLEEEKAIVTDIAGTTRDIVEGKIVLNGIILNIIDTAGIRETDNVVEKIGVEKSINLIDNSDLVILILNNNEIIDSEELELLEKIKEKKNIILVNKTDLENKLDYTKLPEDIIKISVKNNIGINEIKQRIIDLFNIENLETNDMTYLNNKREINLLKESLNSINNAIKSINNEEPIDIVELELKNSWEYLGEIIGESYKEELIDEMFKRFCLGK
jgi:tRNA modification GTPase